MIKKPRAKSKLETHREKKKELADSLEYLRQVDLPEIEGGGSKYVRDVRKQEKIDNKKEEDRVANYLESRISQQFGYRDRIANWAISQTHTLDAPTWEYYCVPTDGSRLNIFGKSYRTQEGVVHILKSPKGNIYVRAVGITYSPEIDMHNIFTMLEQARNTIDSEKGLLLSDNKDTRASFRKTKSGVYLPN